MLSPAAGTARFPWASWAAVVGWIAVILFLGGDRFSQARTEGWLAALLPFFDAGQVLVIDAILRKTAHLVEYAVLGLLAHAALCRTLRGEGRLAAVVLAIALAFAVAAVDEGGQLLRASRSGSLRDVLVDGISGGAGALGSRWRRKRALVPGR